MQKHSLSFEAIGTLWLIETDTPLSTRLTQKIFKRIESFDKTYSRFRSDSLVSQIAKKEGIYTFPNDAVELFAFYKKIYDVTNGKVTPLIGGVLEKAGYDATYSFVETAQTKLPLWDEALQWNGNIVKVHMPVTLDVGAAGKGYLVDLVCGLLDVEGITNYIIDAGGDVRHKGALENKVGLEDPYDPSRVIGAIDVKDKSICASAINRRAWGDGVHHIFDPDFMKPTKEIIATWVIADTAMIADGLATALFFVDPNVLRKQFNFEFLRMRHNGAIDYSTAFEGRLF